MLPGGLLLVASLRLNEMKEEVHEKRYCSEKAHNLLHISVKSTDLPRSILKEI